ncbi:hypothetical protein BX600DRAFT_4877 [Xylariales sp. PMI_506]|nr:hypothetical protein BX600DRAFT_4877 [Xylariales sp. PMI_506]
MNGVGIFFIILVVLLIGAAIGWVVFTQLRARRLGLPAPTLSSYNPFARSDPAPFGAPTPAPGGIRGWFNDKLRGRNNQRSAVGAYEEGRSRRGFGPLDPDDAWDTRVESYEPGHYYEEQELGHRATASAGGPGYLGAGGDPYSGAEYPMNLAATPGVPPPGGFGGQQLDEPRGRSRERTGAGLAAPGAGQHNPFDDEAEPSNMSLRGVSPRPIDTNVGGRGRGRGSGGSNSPTERRSVFRENV